MVHQDKVTRFSKSLDNSSEAKIWGSFTYAFRFLIGQTPQDRNRVWTDIFICSSFPCLLHYFDASRFLSFWAFPNCFLSEISIQVLPSILSFCVWDILLLAHGQRRTFERSYPTYFIQYVFWCNAFFLGDLTLLAFWLSFVAWDYFKYHTNVHPTSFQWVFCC